MNLFLNDNFYCMQLLQRCHVSQLLVYSDPHGMQSPARCLAGCHARKSWLQALIIQLVASLSYPPGGTGMLFTEA